MLEEAGVAMLPGSEFGQEPHILTARMAYVDFDGARALVAAQQLPAGHELDKEFLETYRGNVIEAIERLRDRLMKWCLVWDCGWQPLCSLL